MRPISFCQTAAPICILCKSVPISMHNRNICRVLIGGLDNALSLKEPRSNKRRLDGLNDSKLYSANYSPLLAEKNNQMFSFLALTVTLRAHQFIN